MSELTTNKKDLQSILNSPAVMDRLKSILGQNAATFATSVVQISQSNSLLAKADPNSIIGAAMTAATLNLPLNNSLGFAWIVPYNVKQPNGSSVVKAQFQIGWKGFVQLAMRTQLFKTIHSTDVKQGEIITRDRLTGEMEFQFIDDDNERLKLPTVGYVAFFRLLNGFEATFYMSAAEVKNHGQRYSKSFTSKNGMWNNDFDAMATKTVIKLLLSKKAPLSIDSPIQKAIDTDQAVFNDMDNTEDISYVDNEEFEIDPNLERQRLLIDEAKTLDDISFAEEHVTDPILIAQLDLKKVQIKKESKTDKK